MIRHEYAILPFEIGREGSEHAHKQAQKMGWSRSDTPGIAIYLAYRRPDPIQLPDETEYHVDLVFVDTSACFLLHNIEPQPTQSEYDMAKNILIERNRLNNHLLSNEGNPFLAEVLENLGVGNWRQTKASYVFNFYILEMDGSPTEKTDKALKIISDRSTVGINDKMTAREINQLDFDSMELTRLQNLSDIDPNPHTTIYTTWSAVAAGTWGDKENTNVTKRMLVEMELGLQSVWNHSNQLKISAATFLDNEETDFDQDGLLNTATRFLQTYKQRTSPSSTSSTREVDVLNQLVDTSRLNEEIRALKSSLLTIERKVERKRQDLRQQEHNYRRELGQDWITVVLVLLATIGATQAFIEQRWWEPVIWIFVACLSYWLTVRRTKQKYRK